MKKTNIFPLILAFVIIGGAAWFLSQNNAVKSSNTTITEQKVANVKINSGQLIIATKTNLANQIISFSNNGQNKIIFTDKTESAKILKVGSTNVQTKNIPVIEGTGELALIALDGTGKNQILNQNFNAQDLSLSPSGEKIASISFSNAEKDYGYSLNISDKTGQNTKTIFRSNKILSSPVWLDDKKLVFIKAQIDDKTTLAQIDIATGDQTDLYSVGINENLYDLNFSNEKLLISLGTTDASSSSLYQLDPTGKNPKKLYTEDSGIIYNPTFSSDKNQIAYLVNDMVSDDPYGAIYIINSNGANKQKISTGSKIISWLP